MKPWGHSSKNVIQDCNVIDNCTNYIERAVTEIIQTYFNKGSQPALDLLDFYLNPLLKNKSATNCFDEHCLGNFRNVLQTLRESIESSRHAHVQLSAEIFAPAKWAGQKQVGEEEICTRLVPLVNVTRLRILKILEKGGRNYASLERETGIKAGHLRFHLNKLITAGYVSHEKPQGRYLITRNGLKACPSSP